jgi:Phospholipid methyltransferase
MSDAVNRQRDLLGARRGGLDRGSRQASAGARAEAAPRDWSDLAGRSRDHRLADLQDRRARPATCHDPFLVGRDPGAGPPCCLDDLHALGPIQSRHDVVARHQLRPEGPYAVTRHPIYTGLLGMLLGTALLNGLGIWIGLPLVGVAAFATRVSIEERLMTQAFPDDYRRYRDRVPQLIPK